MASHFHPRRETTSEYKLCQAEDSAPGPNDLSGMPRLRTLPSEEIRSHQPRPYGSLLAPDDYFWLSLLHDYGWLRECA